MLMPVGCNWTLNIYNTPGNGCGSCGSCEVWCYMKHELRIDEGNSLSWPLRLCPQMHKAGSVVCDCAPGTALVGNGGGTRSSGHPSLPHSWGPPATVNIYQLQHLGFIPHCHGLSAKGDMGWSCCSWSLHWLTRAGHPVSAWDTPALSCRNRGLARGLQAQPGSALEFPVIQTCTKAGQNPWCLGGLWGTPHCLAASGGWMPGSNIHCNRGKLWFLGNIKWDETLVPQQRALCCSACSWCGQQKFMFGIWLEVATRLWPQWGRTDAGSSCWGMNGCLGTSSLAKTGCLLLPSDVVCTLPEMLQLLGLKQLFGKERNLTQTMWICNSISLFLLFLGILSTSSPFQKF